MKQNPAWHGHFQGNLMKRQCFVAHSHTDHVNIMSQKYFITLKCTVDDLGQIFDLLSAWKLESKNAPRDLKFNHNVAIWL